MTAMKVQTTTMVKTTYDNEVSEEEWGDGDEAPPYNDDKWGDGNEALPSNDEENERGPLHQARDGYQERSTSAWSAEPGGCRGSGSTVGWSPMVRRGMSVRRSTAVRRSTSVRCRTTVGRVNILVCSTPGTPTGTP